MSYSSSAQRGKVTTAGGTRTTNVGAGHRTSQSDVTSTATDPNNWKVQCATDHKGGQQNGGIDGKYDGKDEQNDGEDEQNCGEGQQNDRGGQLNRGSGRRNSGRSQRRRGGSMHEFRPQRGWSSDLVAKPQDRKRTYTPGTIIIAPYHVTNFNRDVRDDDVHLLRGTPPVYSKTRPMVILWVYHDKLFVAPIFTDGGRGMLSRHNQEKKDELMTVVEVGDRSRDDELQNAVLEAVGTSIAPGSHVSLSGGYNVDLAEEIRIIGHLTEASQDGLMTTWFTVASGRYLQAARYIEDLRRRAKQRRPAMP